MKILGISLGHAFGFTIIENNEIKLIFEYDRLIRVKGYRIEHGHNIPKIRKFVSTIKNITKENVFDEVYITVGEVDRQYTVAPSYIYKILEGFLNSYKVYHKKIERADHRKCHNLSSYMINEGKGLCISMDGGGDGTINVELDGIELEREWDFSFGYFYGIISAHIMDMLGVKFQHESFMPGKFMGFTAYGRLDEVIYNKLTKIFVDSYSRKSEPLPIATDRIIDIITKENLRDFSHTFQRVWVEQVLNYIERFKDYSDRLYVSGGCFLNCPLNRELIETGWFDKIYFTPVADDSGQSLGAALYGCRDKVSFTPFLGPHSFDENTFNGGIDYTAEDIARHVYANRIVGIFRDRMEVGPRALGNRSILANPMTVNMKKILNEKVKHREWFRPYGAIVKKDYIDKYYHMINETSFPYMNIALYNKTDLFPSVTHVDNTTRIQTVTEDDGLIYKILNEFEKLTGHPVLINTSFNIQGKPIINYYEDAYGMFSKGELDILILEDKLYK